MAQAQQQPSENKQRMQRGELYHAFTPELTVERYRCVRARHAFNDNRDPSRRARVALWRALIQDPRPLPPPAPTEQQDEDLFLGTDPWIDPPLHCDYGTQLRFHPTAYINAHCTFIDTLPIRVGARTLFGPSVHIYSGTHPLDPAVRNGTAGPEGGAEVVVEEDCWICGNVTILPGVTVRRGTTVGAGSVVSRSVGPWELVLGNPARAVRKIESEWAKKGEVKEEEEEEEERGRGTVPRASVATVDGARDEAAKVDGVGSAAGSEEEKRQIELIVKEAMS